MSCFIGTSFPSSEPVWQSWQRPIPLPAVTRMSQRQPRPLLVPRAVTRPLAWPGQSGHRALLTLSRRTPRDLGAPGRTHRRQTMLSRQGPVTATSSQRHSRSRKAARASSMFPTLQKMLVRMPVRVRCCTSTHSSPAGDEPQLGQGRGGSAGGFNKPWASPSESHSLEHLKCSAAVAKLQTTKIKL